MLSNRSKNAIDVVLGVFFLSPPHLIAHLQVGASLAECQLREAYR
jgi:hypothetical protein